MRDEIDARVWNAHHDQLSEWIDGAVVGGAARLRRVVAIRQPMPVQLFAGLFAVGLALLTVTASAA